MDLEEYLANEIFPIIEDDEIEKLKQFKVYLDKSSWCAVVTRTYFNMIQDSADILRTCFNELGINIDILSEKQQLVLIDYIDKIRDDF